MTLPVVSLHFKAFGQGPPLIVLHGLFGMLDNWQTLGRRLAQDYTVYLVDQRNHGRSPHAEPHDYPTLAEDLRHFMETQWIYRAHLLGHSMGGKTVMQFAFDNPDMVDHLVVVDIAPVGYARRHDFIFEALQRVPLQRLESRKQAEDILMQHIGNSAIVQFLLKNLARNEDGSFRWKCNLPVLHRYYDAIIGPVAGAPFEGPTLFVKGGASEHILPEHWPHIQQLFPNSQLFEIQGVGHWVHAEAPEVLLQRVQQFLRSNR